MGEKTNKILLEMEQMEKDRKERENKLYKMDDDFDFQEKRYVYCDLCDRTTEQVVEEDGSNWVGIGDSCNPQFNKPTRYTIVYWNCTECDMCMQEITRKWHYDC